MRLWWIALLTLVFVCGCKQNGNAAGCESNVDCSGSDACVLGACIDNVESCVVTGAFDDNALRELNVDDLDEIHTTFDDTGALHYCYTAVQNNSLVTRYGVQTSTKTFDELELVLPDGRQVQCGAISVSENGVPFVFFKNEPGLVYRKEKYWAEVPFSKLQGNDVIQDIAAEQSSIELAPDEAGGMFVSLSVGIDLIHQQVYLAYVKDDTEQVLLDGVSGNDGFMQASHALQVYPLQRDNAEEPAASVGMLVGDLLNEKIGYYTFTEGYIGGVDGGYHRGMLDADGTLWVAYLTSNLHLNVANFSGSAVGEPLELAEVFDAENSNGGIPWKFEVDSNGVAHVAYSVLSERRLYYVAADTNTSNVERQIVSDALPGDINQLSHFDLATDICGRPQIAFVEKQTSLQEDGTTSSAMLLHVLNGN